MKTRLYILIACVLTLFITGCTSTYLRKDFTSKASFFNKINEDSAPADILMKNDSVISVGNVKVVGDSLEWEASNSAGKSALPLKDIKLISYVHHWGSSILFGAFSGLVVGGAVSSVLLEDNTNPRWKRSPYMSGQWEDNTAAPAILGAFAGFLAGGIVGLVAGTDEYFVFDNASSGRDLKYFNSPHKFGLKIGGHSTLTQRSDDSYHSRLTIKGNPSMAVSFFYKYPLDHFLSISSELSYLYSSSKTDFSVFLPSDFEGFEVKGKSEESVSIIELAPKLKINLVRSPMTPYVLIGPRLDILFPGKSGLSNTLDKIRSHNYIPDGVALSSEYSRTVWGSVLGAGFTTGNIFPTELFIEGIFNLDFNTRLTMHSHLDNLKLKYNEFQLNIGAAIF